MSERAIVKWDASPWLRKSLAYYREYPASLDYGAKKKLIEKCRDYAYECGYPDVRAATPVDIRRIGNVYYADVWIKP